MYRSFPRRSNDARPRVVVLGGLRDSLGTWGDGLLRALATPADIRRIDPGVALCSWPRAYRAASALIRRDGFEIVHVLDPRVAHVGAMLRRRCGVPATLTLTAEALRRRGARAALERRAF